MTQRVLCKRIGVKESKFSQLAEISGSGIKRSLPDAFFTSVSVDQDVDGRELIVEGYHDVSSRLGWKLSLHESLDGFKRGLVLCAICRDVEIQHNNALVGVLWIQDGGSIEFKAVVLGHENGGCTCLDVVWLAPRAKPD